MTTYSYTTDVAVTTNATNAINLISDGDDVYVAQGTNISSSGDDSYGISGGDDHRATIAGDVFGNTLGISFGGSDGSNRVIVHSTGSVASSGYAIELAGQGNVVTNAGDISGYYGVVTTEGNGLVNNNGWIYGDIIAVGLDGVSGTTNKLINTGTMSSLVYAFAANAGDDTVINKGTMIGGLSFSGGSDLLDSRGGIIIGSVDLGTGDDKAWGSDATDSIFGGDGNDVIRGRLDNDTLDGGSGKDKLIGGDGDDVFRFTSPLAAANLDTIADFTHGEDHIQLDALYFSALGASVGKGEFVAQASGHSATKASHHLIYDKAKGTLWYDADGLGGVAAVKFAQLGTAADHPTNLSFKDFAIIEIIV